MASNEEIRAIAREVARETVRETLAGLGVDSNDVHEVQRDFAFVRDFRRSSQAIKRQGMLTAIAIVTTGLITLVWLSITGKG